MVPTVLELLGIEAPAKIRGVTQSPIEGASFAHALDNAQAPTRHVTQYFEMMGHRSIYHDGWRAVCPWPGPSFSEAEKPFGEPIPTAALTELDAKHWELYHVAEDFAENRNVATEHRDKLIELVTQWYVEAGRYHVLPVDGRVMLRAMEERPRIGVDRESYTYYPGTQVVPGQVAADVRNRPIASLRMRISQRKELRAFLSLSGVWTEDSPSISRTGSFATSITMSVRRS